MSTEVIVIYYDGNNFTAKRAITEFPNSAMPHQYDLPPEYDVMAVITLPSRLTEVYIDEMLVIEAPE